MDDELLMWTLLGIPAIFLAGCAMHFMFDLLRRWPPVGIFAAVNESVWEHCKLAFWPAVVWAMLTYAICGRNVSDFFLGVALGLAVMLIGIVALFYAYTAVLGHHVLWIDIAIFGVAVGIGQIASYVTMRRAPLGKSGEAAGIGLILLMSALFAIFTFWPPRLPLFKDGPTGTYGIHKAPG